MKTQVHSDILDVLKKQVLPYVIRIQDFDTPWPAHFWIDGCCQHQKGVAMFNISDRGFLTAEYFGYDRLGSFGFSPGIDVAKLIMSDTQAEITTSFVGPNQKTRTLYGTAMPDIESYKCEIDGWIGGSSDTKMQAARMTLLDLPELNLPRTGSYAPDEDSEFFMMRGITTRNAVLKLEAGDWSIQLAESNSNLMPETGRLYHATLTKQDGSPFALSDGQILDALNYFLSFQTGKWVTFSTIVCDPVSPNDWVVERARIGKLTSTATRPHQSGSTATDCRTWPKLFKEFWTQYTDPGSHEHIRHAVWGYVEANRILYDGYIGQALVAAQSTLQALTRWWNGLKTSYQLIENGNENQPSWRQLLINAVQKADLGKDDNVIIDEEALRDMIKVTAGWRNDIDHGRGGNIEGHGQSVVNYQMHHHNLARLLILAKLGNRNRDARGYLTGPKFIRRPALNHCHDLP